VAAQVALLRAVNVGGTGKLTMVELREIALNLGWSDARTYIASGNLLFTAAMDAAEVKARLETALAARLGRATGVIVRTRAELLALIAANPFPHAAPDRTLVTLLDAPPPPDATAQSRGRKAEEIAVIGREIFIHYPEGAGASRLRLPAAAAGTARNLNTLRKLAEILGEMS
jgi:uncharacterized protein (DUF1697 family)